MAGSYSYKQRADKGFDFFDPTGKKINVNQYVQGTGANKQSLVQSFANAGDQTSKNSLFVNQFNGSDVNQQRRLLEGATKNANMEVAGSGADLNAIREGQNQVALINRFGQKKGGNFGTFLADISNGIGGSTDTLGRGLYQATTGNNKNQADSDQLNKDYDTFNSNYKNLSPQAQQQQAQALQERRDVLNYNMNRTIATTDPVKQAGAFVSAASNIPIAGGAGKLIEGGVASLGREVASNALQGAVSGAIGGGANVYAEQGSQARLSDVGRGVMAGGALGGTFGAVTPVIGAGFGKVGGAILGPVPNQATNQVVTKSFQDSARPGVQNVERVAAPTVPAPEVAAAAAPAPVPAGKVPLNPGEAESRFANVTAQNTDEISPELAKMVKENQTTYDTVTNEGRLNNSSQRLGQMSTDDAYLDVAKAFEDGNVNSQNVVDAIHTIKRLDATGNEADLYKATELFDTVSRHLSKKGQEIQAASLLYQRSPQGLFYKAQRDLTKAGVKMSPEQMQALKAATDQIGATTDAMEKQKLIALFQKQIANMIPQGKLDNAISIWKAGLLSGVKTQGGNLVSNATFGALKDVSNPVSAAFDKGLSIFTGQRTKTATLAGRAAGAVEGTKSGIGTLRTGIDPRTLDKYEQFADINLKNPILNKVLGTPANYVFRALGAADQPFYFSALKNNLYDMAKADGINKGLKGEALRAHMNEFVGNPSVEVLESATAAANKAVLGYDTIASKAVQGIHKGIDNAEFASKFSKSVAHGAVNVLAPFVRVPTAFLARTLDYTPIGAVRGIVKAVSQGKGFDQRALSEALGEATTGSGVIFLGATLAGAGLLSGQYPKDPSEQQYWKANKIQPNSVKVGNTWISLNYLGPAGLLMGAGKDFVDAQRRGDNGTVQAIAGFGKNLMGQSFLTGFSGFSDAIQDPERNLKSFLNSQSGSLVPAIVNDAGNVTDKFQRQVNNAGEAIKARIPGLRETLNVKQDVFGNKLDQPAGGLNAAINPLKPSNSATQTNPVLTEVSRLHDLDPNDEDFQITPTTVDQKIKVGDAEVKLTDQQRYDLQNAVGQATQKAWGDFIKTDSYKNLSDKDKAAALDDIRKDTVAVAQRDYVTKNNLGTYTKSLSDAQKAIENGSVDYASYAKVGGSDGSGGTGAITINNGISGDSKSFLESYNGMTKDQRDQAMTSQNDFEYKYDLAKYENDSKNGKLSKAEDARAKNSLATKKVGANFTKDTRDLYGLSKAELYGVLSTDPDGNNLAAQVIAYGDALEDAGVSENKFRDSKGNVAIRPKEKTAGTGGSKKGSDGNSEAISTAGKVSKAVANAKVSKGSLGGFQNKIAKQGLKAYKQPTSTKVRTA